MENQVLTIIGGGNGGHILSGLAAYSGLKVNILTRRPTEWSKTIKVLLENDTDIIEGTLNMVTDDPIKALYNTNFIMLCGPVSAYPSMLNNIKPALTKYNNNKIMLGALFGQCGFHWMCKSMFNSMD